MLQLLRRNRDFRMLFFAQVVSYGGDWFATVALLGLVAQYTHRSALAASGVFIAQMLPAFFMSPFAGTVADRFDRRKIMIVCSVIQTFAALSFLLIGRHTVWIAFAAQGLVAAVGSFFTPAATAAVANLVDSDDLATAATTMGSLWGAMLAIGAFLGGIFTGLFGRSASFVADAASFIVAGLLIAAIRRSTSATVAAPAARRPPVRPIHDTREALVYARSDHGLMYLLCSKGGLGLAMGVVGLLTVVALKRFDGGDIGVGILLGARGLGAVLGPLVARRFAGAHVPSIVRICGLAALIYGVAYAGIAISPILPIAALLTFVAHLGGGTQWTLSTYGLQLIVPDAFLGRIIAADFAIATFTATISYVAAGLLERSFGAGAAMATLATIALAWGLVYLRLSQTMRATPEALPLGAPDSA